MTGMDLQVQQPPPAHTRWELQVIFLCHYREIRPKQITVLMVGHLHETEQNFLEAHTFQHLL